MIFDLDSIHEFFLFLWFFQVDTILEFSNNQQTKYYALQILESVIKTRWKVLPRNQCDGIKKYIVGLIIKTSSDQQLMEKEKTYLNKLNMILVQVKKGSFALEWNFPCIRLWYFASFSPRAILVFRVFEFIPYVYRMAWNIF